MSSPMESSDPVPSHPENVQRGSQPDPSTSRMDTGHRLVHRMPNNPKIIAFESTQQRFEVPLRPEMWSPDASRGGPVTLAHQQPKRVGRRKRNVSDVPSGDFMEDNHHQGRKKTTRRKSNVIDKHNAESREVDVTRRSKEPRSSLRSSKLKNAPADNSRRLTDYFHSCEGIEVPRRSNMRANPSHTPNIAGQDGHAQGDGMSNFQPGMPQIHVPRMRDLLSRPLSLMSGRPLQAFLQMFDQFDATLSENTRAIHACLCNIARAPLHLADQCRPVIDEIIRAQRYCDPNIIGESSRRNNGQDDDNEINCHNVHSSTNVVAEDGMADNRHDQSADVLVGQGETTALKHNQPLCTAPRVEPDSIQSSFGARGGTPSNHDEDRLNSLVNAIYDEENHSDTPQFHTNSAEQDEQAHILLTSKAPSSSLSINPSRSQKPNIVCGLQLRPPGTRLTKKPPRYCSPFKVGIMSRPPPNVDVAMSLRGYLCADDSPLKRTAVMQIGSTPLTGSSIARSFGDDVLPEPIFMTGFVRCVSWDDYFIRPECYGYRIFLDAEVSAILNVEWTLRGTSEPKYSQAATVAAINRCLPHTDLKETKMVQLF